MSFPAGWLAVCGLKREAAIWATSGARCRAVVGGGRSDLLSKRLEAAIKAERPAGIVSFGLAGALRPELRVGDGVVGYEVFACDGERWDCDPEIVGQLARLAGARSGEVAGSDEVVSDSATKRALGGVASIVDMESHIAARAAAAHGLLLAVLRVVSDEADHALPPAAVAGMREDGAVDVVAVLRALARDPRQLTALIRTGRDAGRAFHRLAELRRAIR